jgi:hypothetical protein
MKRRRINMTRKKSNKKCYEWQINAHKEHKEHGMRKAFEHPPIFVGDQENK